MQINLKSYLNPEKDAKTNNNLKQLKFIQRFIDISYMVK